MVTINSLSVFKYLSEHSILGLSYGIAISMYYFMRAMPYEPASVIIKFCMPVCFNETVGDNNALGKFCKNFLQPTKILRFFNLYVLKITLIV